MQVTLDSRTQFALDALANLEQRSTSNMAATLIREALIARGIDQARVELPKPVEAKPCPSIK